MIKDEIRIIGWDDCSHKSGQKNVLVVGVVFRGGKFIDPDDKNDTPQFFVPLKNSYDLLGDLKMPGTDDIDVQIGAG